jgi:hypothetical protein
MPRFSYLGALAVDVLALVGTFTPWGAEVVKPSARSSGQDELPAIRFPIGLNHLLTIVLVRSRR